MMQALQNEIEARLAAAEYFADIPVFSERKKDVANEVSRALGTLAGKGGKKGICAVVLQPVGNDQEGNLPTVELHMRVSVKVIENVLINASATGTQKAALKVAEKVVALLKHYWPRGIADILVPESPTIVPVEDASGLAYEVRLQTTVHSERLAKAAMPQIGVSGEAFPKTVTMTAAEGATIYWTSDLSHPWSGNTAATLYTAPVELAAAATIRAVAYKTGMAASDAAWQEVA